MKKNYTHIAVVLDKSGSMASCVADTRGGFNTFLAEQRKVEGEATITMIQFDNQYEIMHDMVAIKDASELNDKNYIPRADTALLDAIGRTINNVEHAITEKDEDQKPEKVIFVIITDGAENASREFTREQIMEMINRHRDEDKWEFVFIGANQDAIQAGGSMGIRAGSTLGYVADAQGTRCMYASLTSSMTNYRCATKAVDSFFEEKKENKEDFLKNSQNALKNIYVGTTTNQTKK